MTSPLRFGLGLSLLLIVGVAGWVRIAMAQAPQGGQGLAEGPKTTAFAPLDYFQNQCARCHGDYGSAYGSEFGKKLTEQQLEGFVRDMADGPAQAPLSDADLAVETAFHRALRDGKPFAVVVAWKDGVLSGEATPGSKVSIEIKGETTAIPLEGNAWKVSLPKETAWGGASLRVSKGGKETVIPIAKRAF